MVLGGDEQSWRPHTTHRPISFCTAIDFALLRFRKDEIVKGRILIDLRDIWRVFGENLPLQNLKEKHKKQRKAMKNICSVIFL